jgi:hypothetical protein
MDPEQFDKIHDSINRIAAATLTAAMLAGIARKPSLKDVQTMFNDCYMIVNPAMGTVRQNDFQERIDKKEW